MTFILWHWYNHRGVVVRSRLEQYEGSLRLLSAYVNSQITDHNINRMGAETDEVLICAQTMYIKHEAM